MSFLGFGKKKKNQQKVSAVEKPLSKLKPVDSTFVEEENASFQVPDFSEDDLNFDLDADEFLPDVNTINNSDKNNKNMSDLKQKRAQDEINKTLNSSKQKKDVSAGETSLSKSKENKDILIEKNNAAEDTLPNVEEKLSEDASVPDLTFKDEDFEEKNKKSKLSKKESLKKLKLDKKLPTFDLKNELVLKKNEDSFFFELGIYKDLLHQESELLKESAQNKAIFENIKKYSVKQENLFNSTEELITEVKDNLLKLDEKIFEINQNM